jgi:hypothetical protein
MKFDDLEILKKQIALDVAHAEEYFLSYQE